MWPSDDISGILSPKEYFRHQALVKGKHKSRKWGTKANRPDPKLEISVGDTLLVPAMRWNPIKMALK